MSVLSADNNINSINNNNCSTRRLFLAMPLEEQIELLSQHGDRNPVWARIAAVLKGEAKYVAAADVVELFMYPRMRELATVLKDERDNIDAAGVTKLFNLLRPEAQASEERIESVLAMQKQRDEAETRLMHKIRRQELLQVIRRRLQGGKCTGTGTGGKAKGSMEKTGSV